MKMVRRRWGLAIAAAAATLAAVLAAVVPPTGRQFAISGIDIHAFRGGQMAEHWHVVDLSGLLQQLGVIPALGQAPA